MRRAILDAVTMLFLVHELTREEHVGRDRLTLQWALGKHNHGPTASQDPAPHPGTAAFGELESSRLWW